MTHHAVAGLSKARRAPDRPPEYRYHLLRAALAAGGSGLAGLNGADLQDVTERADKTFELESLVLGSPEAAEVVIADAHLEQSLFEVSGRYPDRDAFLADLAGNGLEEETLGRALRRELIFDAVMQRVAARRPAVSDLDERLFFELHKDRFTLPERRTARQILITVNDELVDNRRDRARSRIDGLAEKLAARPNRFSSLARKHSECPSALEGGRLGIVPRGALYDSLDAALFALAEGEVSRPVESELGFHLLLCEKIHRSRSLPFSKERARIRELLEARAGRNCQKAWISELQRGVL